MVEIVECILIRWKFYINWYFLVGYLVVYRKYGKVLFFKKWKNFLIFERDL